MNQSTNIIEQLKSEEKLGLLTLQSNSSSDSNKKLDHASISIIDDNQQLKEISINKTDFFDLIAILSDWMWELDKDGRYVSIKGDISSILGYKVNEVIGKTLFDFMTTEEADRLSSFFSSISNEKKPIINLECWNVARNGDKICLLINAVPIFDNHEELIGYRGISKDITRKKLADIHADEIFENRNALFRVLYDTAIEVEGADPKKIFQILTRNLRKICKANYAALASYDSKSNIITMESIDSEEFINQNMQDTVDKTFEINEEIINDFKYRQISECKNHHNCLVDFFPKIIPPTYQLSNGNSTCYRLSCIREGKLIALGFVFLPEDTRLKMKDIVDTYLSLAGMVIERIYDTKALAKSEMLYKNLSKDLEKKVKERTLEVEKLLKLKDEFINQLGHDLKNPLGPLINLLPILQKKNNNPEFKDIFNVLIRNTMYMKNLVTKTISLAQLNSPNYDLFLEPLNLKREIEELITNNKILLDEKKIDLKNFIPNDLLINADKLRLSELFDNILNNAIKYSKDYCEIMISSEDKTDFIKVKIKDTGIGMTSQQIDHIFDEFYKVDPSRHDFDSNGLGMPIAKRIVEKHGGKIWVQSEGLGKGTTIIFTLPKVNRF